MTVAADAVASTFEQFAALSALPTVQHAFTLRVPGIEVSHDKATALQRLDRVHAGVRSTLSMGDWPFTTAQQVHGARVAVVDRPIRAAHCFADCDGVITNVPRVCLGIYVADCCAVYLVDPERHAIGLVHSGRKGTEFKITARAIEAMIATFGCDPATMIAQLSPCIRPPHYEVDFAGDIRAQCRAAGIEQVHDANVCTACDLTRYYSYRAEKGRTGRMLALLALAAA